MTEQHYATAPASISPLAGGCQRAAASRGSAPSVGPSSERGVGAASIDRIAQPCRCRRKPLAMHSLIYQPIIVVLTAFQTHPANVRFDRLQIFFDRDQHHEGLANIRLRKDRIAA